MAVEMFSWQVSTNEYAGRGDRTRGRFHAKRTRFRSSYRARLKDRSQGSTNHWNNIVSTLTEPPHEKKKNGICAQRRLRSAWASTQSSLIRIFAVRLTIAWVLSYPFERTAKTLIRLGICPGWSKSSLGATPFSWFCHEAESAICNILTWHQRSYGVTLTLIVWANKLTF